MEDWPDIVEESVATLRHDPGDHTPIIPEKVLFAKIIERAIQDIDALGDAFNRLSRQGQQAHTNALADRIQQLEALHLDAWHWVHSERTDLFSFRWLCGVLNLSDRDRRRILASCATRRESFYHRLSVLRRYCAMPCQQKMFS